MGAEHMGGRETARQELLASLREQLLLLGADKKKLQALVNAVVKRTTLGESMVTAWLGRPGVAPEEFENGSGRKGF